MTPTQVCKAIQQLKQLGGELKLSPADAATHAAAETLVQLYTDGFVRPLDPAIPALIAYYKALDTVRVTAPVTLEYANAYVAGKIGDGYHVAELDGTLWLIQPTPAAGGAATVATLGLKGCAVARFHIEVAKFQMLTGSVVGHPNGSWAETGSVTPPITARRSDEVPNE